MVKIEEIKEKLKLLRISLEVNPKSVLEKNVDSKSILDPKLLWYKFFWWQQFLALDLGPKNFG